MKVTACTFLTVINYLIFLHTLWDLSVQGIHMIQLKRFHPNCFFVSAAIVNADFPTLGWQLSIIQVTLLGRGPDESEFIRIFH